jgi:hypothetical protein
MSEYQTPQQLTNFFISLLRANIFTRRWVDFWNPTTLTNRELPNPMFSSMTKESKALFKEILRRYGVRFEQNGIMEFPENFQDVIPQIVEEFMRLMSPQATEAVAVMPPLHAVCGGGAAVAEESSSDSCAGGGCSVSESSDNTPKKCSGAGGNSMLRGKLPERGGPTIMVCTNWQSCKYGNDCKFPHPTNPSCVFEERMTKSGIVYIAKVCTLKKCKCANCPCAHLPKDVIAKALERKRDAFSKSSRRRVDCSAVACSAVACSVVHCDSVLEADLEVASLTGALSELSFEKPHCGGEAHACSLPTESPCVVEDCNSVLEADLEVASLTGALSELSLEKPHCGGEAHACSLPTESPCVVEGDLFGLLDQIALAASNGPERQPSPSAPLLLSSSFGQWSGFIHPITGVSYFQNEITGEVQYTPPNFFNDNSPACDLSASCVVMCEAGSSRVPKRRLDAVQLNASSAVMCEVVRGRKVKQEDASDAPKKTKRPNEPQSPESSKKPRK